MSPALGGRGPALSSGQSGERGGRDAVGGGVSRTRDLAAQHFQLVAQDEYLGVLGKESLAVRLGRPQQALDQLVEEREGHGRAAWSG